MDSYDAVIIGGGAAGLNAGLVLGRSRRRVLVVDGGRPRNAPAAHMQGFLSRDGLPPADLLEIGRTEVRGYGGEIVTGTVTRVDGSGPFTVRTDDGRAYRARRLLVATSLTDRLPDVPGVRERWGRDVNMCPYCHGWENRDQALAVLGTMPSSLEHALLLSQWTSDLVYLPHLLPAPTGEDAAKLAARGIEVVPGEVERLVVENDRLTGVAMADGTVLARQGLYLAAEFVPNDAILTGLGCAVEDGWVKVDGSGATSVPGVYAAGNVVNPKLGVIHAAAAGSMAGMAINADLVFADVAEGVKAA
ncbi:NAD(P)/FAD-dependent oxidoreductase [Actinomadura hibisca]|uniref:NAD(P)/FAD-dependent oxidoreductase n=1 Tax=Actinomadura hibisca TaxID=68565 RepID=UPI00083707EA|nr:NAD(P)/FAD-dependent oxidoreductase [Actinomadura hibisca]